MTKQYLTDLVAKGYPDTLTAYDPALLAQTQLSNGCVWDIDTGLLLKLGERKEIIAAVYGFAKVPMSKIQEMYGSPPRYTHLKWPESNKITTEGYGNHWVFMGYFESFLCQVVS
jgi:hypothetical protein